VDQELRRAWLDRLIRQGASGATVAEFCRREGISEPSFYSWRKRLGRGAGSQRRAPARRGGGRGAKPAAAAVEPRVRFVQVPLAASPRPAVVELTLADGTLIRVPEHADGALERILGLLLARVGGDAREARHD
jgi:transposase-like protein